MPVARSSTFFEPGDVGADLVDDLGRLRVDGERADVAPVERQRAPAGREQVAGVADIEIDLVGRPVFGGLVVDLEAFAKASLLTSGFMSRGVEEGSLGVPLDWM